MSVTIINTNSNSSELLLNVYALEKSGVDYVIKKNSQDVKIHTNLSTRKKKQIKRIVETKRRGLKSGINILTRENVRDSESGAISAYEMHFFNQEVL